MSNKNSYLKRYGMTAKDWERLYAATSGECPLCEKPFGKKRLACVDHDHKTGVVRGLLCQQCNWTLGLLHDNEAWLGNAHDYLLFPTANYEFYTPRRHVDAPPER